MAASIVCCTTTLKIFRIYQFFPAKGQELEPGKIFFVKLGFMCLLSSAIVDGSLMHFIHSFHSKSYNYVYNDMTYVLALLTGYSFFVCFSFNLKSATKLFIFLSDFKKFGKPPKFDERNRQLNGFSRYHYIYISLVSFLCDTNIFRSSQCFMENEEYNLSEVCGLITNAWLPFDIDYFPVKQVYIILQVFSMYYICVCGGMVTWFVLEVVEHISVRIDHVRQLFASALDEKNAEEMKRKFSVAAEYHSCLLNLEDDLNKSFSMPMFFMMLLGAAILGCAAFGYMETGSNNLLVMCLGWFNGLALVSIAGQRLINKSMSIAEVIYNTKWFDVGHILGKDIIIVIARCQKPMKLRAAAFGVMNHSMIVSVSRAAYSYLSILSAMYK